MDKKIIYLLIIFVLVAAAAAIKLKNSSSSMKEEKRMEIVSDKVLMNTKMIEIVSKNSDTILLHLDKKWVVENKFKNPSDFSKIKDLIRDLKNMEVIDRFHVDMNKNAEVMKRQKLIAPEKDKENSGTLIKLIDKNDKVIFSMIAGERRKKGGEFIYLPEKKEVITVKSYIYINVEPKEWLKSDLIDIDGSKISKISVEDKPGKKLLVLEKNKETLNKELIFPAEIKGKKVENETLDKGKLDKFFAALKKLELRDIRSEKKDRDEYDFKIVFQTENGSEIEAKLKNSSGQYSISLDIIKKSDQDKFSSRNNLEKFIYEISKWDFENFITNPEELLKKEKK